MSSRVLLFGAVLIALITVTGRAQASTSRSCSMLSRVDRVTRGLGMQLQVDLFVVETSDNDPTMCLPRGPSTKVAAEAVDFATVTRVRVGSWVWFTHSHDISHPNPEGLTQSTRTRRLSIAPPSDAARGELLAKQPPVEPAGSAHAVFKALARKGSLAPTLSGSAARDPDPASPRLIAKWATASLILTFANPPHPIRADHQMTRRRIPVSYVPLMHRLGAVVPLASLAACSPHAVEPHSVPPAGEPVEYAKPKRLQDEAFTFRGLPVVHSVPTEQAQRTLLPIYVEFPPEAGITRAVVNVRPPEEDSYSYVLMRKSGKGFAVELPCIAVYRVGTLRLFITGTFERSDGFQVTVGSLGSNSNPFLVYIKPTITGPPPALPGREPSKKCQCHDCGVPGYLLGSGNDESGR